MVTVEIPHEYGYVFASIVSTFFVSQYLSMRVSSFRKAANVPYPYEYASYEQVQTASPQKAKALLQFNAAQRSHQNFNENHPVALASMLIAGLNYPVATATLGALWSANRILYGLGYTRTADTGGKGRYNGGLWMIAHFALMGMAGKVAFDVSTA